MENLRWILILAGVAILVLLYFSGRKRTKANSMDRRGTHAGDNGFDPLLGDDPLPEHSAGFNDFDQDDFARPAQQHGGQASSSTGYHAQGYDLDDELVGLRDSSPGFTSFAQKIEAISERLSPKRRERVAESEPADLGEQSEGEVASKIVTLHIVAPQNSLLNGEQLLNLFERRGYHFGDLNIFHSMHNGDTVFSIAKMIEPGFFDIDDINSFVTPGITLILQLPGPVAADVSFAVLMSEAFEMAEELNATVLDGDRNTLSKQTIQHMREGIYEFMHRQKYFGRVSTS